MLNLKKIKIKDIVIIVLILGATFGYFLDAFISEELKSIELIFFKINSFGFENIKELVQYIRMKLLIIFLSIIWYFTCQYWWKSAILVILIIEILKLVSAFISEQKFIDEIEYVKSLPITIPIILGIVLISKKINYYNLAKNVRYDIDNKIDDVFFELNNENDEKLNILKEKFFNVKTKYIDKSNLNYIEDLIALRDEFYKQ